MKLNIIRNCSHYGYVVTGILLNDQGGQESVIRKTFVEDGVKSIQREVEGLSWYCKRLGVNIEKEVLLLETSKSYAQLRLPFHKGAIGNYYLALDKNYSRFINLIDYYEKVFLKEESFFSHGDFSLGNIIFNGNDVQWIIDWENVNDVMSVEYDLVYSITENCLFRLYLNKGMSKNEVKLFHQLMDRVQSKMIVDKEALKKPASWCRNVVLQYMEKTGVRHDKCPFVAVNGSLIEKLDKLLM